MQRAGLVGVFVNAGRLSIRFGNEIGIRPVSWEAAEAMAARWERKPVKLAPSVSIRRALPR